MADFEQATLAQGRADNRVFAESSGQEWLALLGHDPARIGSALIRKVLTEGGTRKAWQWTDKGRDYVLMAWPADQPVRAGVLMAGKSDEKLEPCDLTPLLEGLPNDLTVHSHHARQLGQGGEVGVSVLEGSGPMWFYDPLYRRDLADLTPGVTHTFWLSALAFSIRESLLDEITITRGPRYEAWAENWLKENPGQSRLDVPPLKVDIEDMPLIMPGHVFGEYQIRGVVEEIQKAQFEKIPVSLLYLSFPLPDRPALRIPLYASAHVLGKYEPEKGDEIDAYIWLQGRIIDLDTESEK